MFERIRQLFTTRARVAYTGNNEFWNSTAYTMRTRSGAMVGKENAMTVATVYACVRAISQTLGYMNLNVLERIDSGRRLAFNHPAHQLCAVRPNEYQTPYEFWESITAMAQVYGRAFAHIVRNSFDGRPTALHILHTNDCQLMQMNGMLFVRHSELGDIKYEDVFSVSCLNGKSPIELHQENIGIAKAAENYGADFFGSDGSMLGILSTDNPIKNEQMDAVRRSWATGGIGVKVLPFGFKYQQISLPPEQAQFLQTRRYSDETICTIMGVPPQIVGVNTQTTYSNTEEQGRNFARHTIVPWATRIEQEVNLKLIPEFEREEFFAKFNMQDLLRGDTKARSEFYHQMLTDGVFTINEVRRQEDYNTIGPQGDMHLVQVNQMDLGTMADYSEKISSNAV
jgi:HK97 family phage portal protein